MDNPYEVMPSLQQDQLGPPPLPPPRMYRSGNGLAMATAILLGSQVLLSGLTGITSFAAASAISGGESLSGSAAVQLAAFGGLAILLGFANLATIIVYLIWLHRAYSNLSALDAGFLGKFTPGWAVGWWFIPFANLVMPYQAVNELYVASVRSEANESGYAVPPSSGIVGWWWAAFILRGVVSWFGGGGSSMRDLESTLYWNGIGAMISIVAAVLCIVIVLRINRGQIARALRATA